MASFRDAVTQLLGVYNDVNAVVDLAFGHSAQKDFQFKKGRHGLGAHGVCAQIFEARWAVAISFHKANAPLVRHFSNPVFEIGKVSYREPRELRSLGQTDTFSCGYTSGQRRQRFCRPSHCSKYLKPRCGTSPGALIRLKPEPRVRIHHGQSCKCLTRFPLRRASRPEIQKKKI